MKFLLRSVLASLVLPSVAALGHAQVVFSNDFQTNGDGFSVPTRQTLNGETFLAATTGGSGNGSNVLSLSGLPAHDQVTLTFDLYIIQSWDGNGPNGGGEDRYRLFEDGTQILSTTFANYGGGNTQSYPDITGTNTSNAPKTGAFETNHLGFGAGDFGDTTYRITLSFAHTASSLQVEFQSNQNQVPGDEGWGLDNVTVGVRPVPEPASLAALGLGAVALVRRRRRA